MKGFVSLGLQFPAERHSCKWLVMALKRPSSL